MTRTKKYYGFYLEMDGQRLWEVRDWQNGKVFYRPAKRSYLIGQRYDLYVRNGRIIKTKRQRPMPMRIRTHIRWLIKNMYINGVY